ncbi:MAG: SRPBCC domain-containing protein [Streptosporangiaceae bacterium]
MADSGETGLTAPEASDPGLRKSVTVPARLDEAFQIFTERPIDWLPPAHTFLANPSSIAMEPRVGGRFFERGTDGEEISRGTILEWAPPDRLVVTWRVGPGWRPLQDDEKASRIEVDFTAVTPDVSEVVLTYTQLWRCGAMAGLIRSALSAPGPGESLSRYAEAVARHRRAR